MGRFKLGGAVLGFWALLLFLLSPVSGEGAEKLKKVRVAIPSTVLDIAPMWIAKDKGFWAEEGLDVEVTYIRGNTRGVQALLAGQIEAGYGGSAAAISANAGGADLAVIVLPTNTLAYVLASREPIEKPSDLHGKKFAISAFGGSSEVATRIAIETAGADPDKVVMIQVGGSSKRLAALKSGSVDAAILGGATFVGRGEGLHKVIDLAEAGIEYPFSGLYTTKKFASENKQATLGLVRGLIRGIRFFETNKDETLEIAARYLRNPDPKILERQWQYIKDHRYERVPYVTEKGFKLVVDMLSKKNPKVAELKVEDVSDMTAMDELLKTGFFTRSAMEGKQE